MSTKKTTIEYTREKICRSEKNESGKGENTYGNLQVQSFTTSLQTNENNIEIGICIEGVEDIRPAWKWEWFIGN